MTGYQIGRKATSYAVKEVDDVVHPIEFLSLVEHDGNHIWPVVLRTWLAERMWIICAINKETSARAEG